MTTTTVRALNTKSGRDGFFLSFAFSAGAISRIRNKQQDRRVVMCASGVPDGNAAIIIDRQNPAAHPWTVLASKYARLKEIRWGSSRPLKDFTV
jgi:hypothetical protein